MINLIEISKHKNLIASDRLLNNLSKDILLVSSKQLALFLGKKNDNSLRASRSNGKGFKYYKDPDGNVFYNLIEILKTMGVKI